MSEIHVEASRIVDARPDVVYGILSDYRTGHPAILPKPYFAGLTLERGGKGAGTVVQAHLSVMGVNRTYRLEVSEPEPGRVLMEVDREAGVVTTFTVEPWNGGGQSRVTIASDTRPSPGVKGWMERLLNPPITRRIYREELQQLDAYARNS